MANQNPDKDLEFCEAYVEHILDRVFDTKHWSVADILLQTCPREHLPNVAFILLGHISLEDGVHPRESH